MLVDPWLVGNLIFLEQDWLFKGSKKAFNLDKDAVAKIVDRADFILLSQVGCVLLLTIGHLVANCCPGCFAKNL